MGKDGAWWVPLVEGIIAIGLALYILFVPDLAVVQIGLVAALYILVMGIINAAGGFMGTHGSSSLTYQGIAGVVIGGILTVMYFFQWGSVSLGYTLLALGLIIYGGLGLWAYFFDRGKKAFAWGPVLFNLALLVWGVLIFISRSRSFNLATVSAWILIALGGLAIGWAFYLRSRRADAPAT